MRVSVKTNESQSYRGLLKHHLTSPIEEVDTTFLVSYGANLEHHQEGTWGLVPHWVRPDRFEEVAKSKRILHIEKVLYTPSCLEENGARRGVVRCETIFVKQNSDLKRLVSHKFYWAPVIFNIYQNREANERTLTFSVITRKASSYELRLQHPLQVPVELPDPLKWVDPRLSKFDLEPLFQELLRKFK